MEEIIYQKDYTPKEEEKKTARPLNKKQKAKLAAHMDHMALQVKLSGMVPKQVIPGRKETFDHLTELCDTIAKEHIGTISAYLDPQLNRAVIELHLPCALFDLPNELEDLRDIVNHADSIFIFPDQKRPALKLQIDLDYFQRTPIDTISSDTLLSMARTIAEEMDLSCTDAELLDDVLDVVRDLRQEEHK